MKKLFAITSLIATLTASSVLAQNTLCGITEEVHKSNLEQGNELKVVGVDFDGNLLEIWEADDGKYGLLVTNPSEGLTCYIAGGTSLQVLPAQPRPRPDL